MNVVLRSFRRATLTLLLTPVVAASAAPSISAQTTCRNTPGERDVRVPLPGRAFHAIASSDGCWIFVSMQAAPDSSVAGIAVIKRMDRGASLARVVVSPPQLSRPNVFGLALTHDGRVLIAASLDRLTFYDVARLTSGAGDAMLGVLHGEASLPGYFHLSVTANDRYLFASNHADTLITIIDLAEARRSSFATIPVVGKIPVGFGPASVVLSSDERLLYVATQYAADSWHWPTVCRAPLAQPGAPPNRTKGAIQVIDAARAVADPAHAVLATASAGCEPVRLVLSPAGDRAYVTARSDNTLIAFDTRRLVADSAHAVLGIVPMQAGPVGISVVRDGRIAVTNALRFTGVTNDSESVTLVDAGRVASGRAAIIGRYTFGSGPVDLSLTSDGRTLIVTNFESRALFLVNVDELKP